MTFATFFSECLFPHYWLYLLSLLVVFILYIPIIKNVAKSILDPLFFILIGTIFANAVPVFLFFLQEISMRNFIYFVLSEFLFWISFFLFWKKKVSFSQWNYSNEKMEYLIYIFTMLILIASNLITYVTVGIPLFLESRLETYSSGGGLGILAHLQNFSTIYCVIYSFYLIGQKRHLYQSWFLLSLVVLFSFFSGSKSSILQILFCYYFYLTYYCEREVVYNKIKKYICLVILFPVFMLMIVNNSSFELAVISLLNRFIANGDVYWLAYPNDTIDMIEINKPFVYLFSRILGPFRLIDYSDIETAIGLQLNWEVYPSEYGVMKGCNARLPILNWVLFQWKGLFLSVVFGAFCAWWKTRLPNILPKGIAFVIVYAFLYINLVSMFVDPILGTSYLFTFVVFVLFLLVCIILFNKGKVYFHK